jgi:hypothetical protein
VGVRDVRSKVLTGESASESKTLKFRQAAALSTDAIVPVFICPIKDTTAINIGRDYSI